MSQAQRTRRQTAGPGVLMVLVFAVLWFVFSTPAYAQEQPPDLPTYTLWLREAQAAAGRGDRLGLEDVAGRLVSAREVRLSDGATVAVDNSWLRDDLADAEPDLATIGTRIGAIIDALALPPSAAPADARERLRQILDQPPFKQQQPSPPPGWWTAFWEWLGRLLESLLRPVGRAAAGNAEPIAWVIGIVGLLLLLGVIIYLLRGLRRGLVAEAVSSDDDPEANLTARAALEQASGLARGGDYRTAVRYLYLSALLWLDERDILRYDRALTNREYLERVRDNPVLTARLAPVVETFDRVWYGHLPIDAETFAAYQRQVEELRLEVKN